VGSGSGKEGNGRRKREFCGIKRQKKSVKGDLREEEFQGGGNRSHGRRSKVKKCKKG